MVNVISFFYKCVTFIKCCFIRLRGAEIFIGPNTSIHPSVVLSATRGSKISIGKNCAVLKGAILATYGGNIEIGDNVSVNPYTILYGHGGLKIGNDVRIAAHCVIIPAEHIFEEKGRAIHSQGISARGIKIGNDVWIASGVKILDGSDVKDGCVLGANAVMKGCAEEYGVYAGIPAKKVKNRK